MQASRPLVVCSRFNSPRLPCTPCRQVSVDHNAALHGVDLQDIQLHRISLMERSRVVRGMMTCALWLGPAWLLCGAACGFFLGVPQDGESAQCVAKIRVHSNYASHLPMHPAAASCRCPRCCGRAGTSCGATARTCTACSCRERPPAYLFMFMVLYIICLPASFYL